MMKHFYNMTMVAIILAIGIQVNAQPFNFDGLTTGSVGTLSNGWVGSPTTGYAWQADAAGTTSSGTGPAVDHTTGTSTGIYMYVEASTPAIAGDVALLTSPNITLTVPFVGFSFWYHRAGTSMGNLYIDVYNGSTWVQGVDSLVGAQQAIETDPWLNKIVNLSGFSGTVQVRFRAVCGASWSGDMAIDDVSMAQIPPYDASLESVIPSVYYVKTPLSQAQPITFSGLVKGAGSDTITNVTLNASINGAIGLSGSIASVLPLNIDTVTLSTTYTPTSVGLYITDFNVSIAEPDTNLFNDSAEYRFEVTDTIYSREDDNIIQGIGFTGGTGVFGQMFEIFNTDSLTSVTFKLTAPTALDNIKLKLYGWNATAGTPGTIMDSTAAFSVPNATNSWYTLQFPCDHILTPGKYFFAVEQITTNNLSVGYTSEYYEPGTTFYDGGAGWTGFEVSGFNVALAIRPNFGPASWPTVDLGNDTAFCAGSSVTLTAPSGWSSYLWEDGTSTAANTISTVDTTWVKVTNARGCAAYDTIIVSENPTPAVVLPANVGICDGAVATLVANNDPTLSYLWNDGTTDSTLVTSTAGLYSVTVTSNQGCVNTGFAVVQVGITPTAQISVDTAYYCAGSDVTITAAGSGNIYNWSNGTTGNSTQINQPGMFFLTVTSPAGCIAFDTAFAVEKPVPFTALSANTIQFCDNEFGSLSVSTTVGSSYLWSTGDTTAAIAINTGGQYWVQKTYDGCSSSDTGMATVLASPVVDLGADTVICSNYPDSALLDGGPGVAWTWSTGANTQTIKVKIADEYSVITENTDGCKGYDTIMVDAEICSSVFDLNGTEGLISVYPNPASSMVTLNMQPDMLNARMQILDAKGTIVYENVIAETEMNIPVTQWSNGVYIVKVNTLNDAYTLKLMVKH